MTSPTPRPNRRDKGRGSEAGTDVMETGGTLPVSRTSGSETHLFSVPSSGYS